MKHYPLAVASRVLNCSSGWSLLLYYLRLIYISQSISARDNHPEVISGKFVLKICSKSTGKHPCRSVILIKLQSDFIEITLRHRCSPVNLLHIFKTTFVSDHFGTLCIKGLRGSFIQYVRKMFRMKMSGKYQQSQFDDE